MHAARAKRPAPDHTVAGQRRNPGIERPQVPHPWIYAARAHRRAQLTALLRRWQTSPVAPSYNRPWTPRSRNALSMRSAVLLAEGASRAGDRAPGARERGTDYDNRRAVSRSQAAVIAIERDDAARVDSELNGGGRSKSLTRAATAR